MDASLGRSRSLNVRAHPERRNESFAIASATVLPREKVRRRVTKVVVAPM